jgi:hypothetical protein
MSLVLCLLHGSGQAVDLLRSHQDCSETWQQTLVSIRTIEALLMIGQSAEIAPLVAELMKVVPTRLEETVVPSEVDLYRHLASLMEHLEYREHSRHLAADCYASYTRLDDELGAFYAAQISHRCAMDSGERTRWSNVISLLAASSSYSTIHGTRDCRTSHTETDRANNIRQMNLILLSEA